MKLGFYRKLPSTWQEFLSRTIPALNEMDNIAKILVTYHALSLKQYSFLILFLFSSGPCYSQSRFQNFKFLILVSAYLPNKSSLIALIHCPVQFSFLCEFLLLATSKTPSGKSLFKLNESNLKFQLRL